MFPLFAAFCALSVVTLREMNSFVFEPYMDEPFHIAQAQAYCRGEWTTWDPKITTPPGLYISSLILKTVFVFKCTLPMLRLTALIPLLALPLAFSRLRAFHERQHPPRSLLEPRADSVVLSMFPIAWFFGLLYYTDVPSLLFVVLSIAQATNQNHWLAALLGFISCTFRQTNILWVLYGYAISRLMEMRFRRMPKELSHQRLYDPPALTATIEDIPLVAKSFIQNIMDVFSGFIPYSLLILAFMAFVAWNGGIVLGDKSNHVPVIHVPQLYYFIAFCTAFGWPILLTAPEGPTTLVHNSLQRMFGSKLRILTTLSTWGVMALTVHLFTIHHPFVLSDNRHYVFYVWRRIFMFHPLVPYLFVPFYHACAWVWFIRIGQDQSILQTLCLPLIAMPALIPTPLIEPRYFLIPYILLRAQVTSVSAWSLTLEALWYALVNAVTMSVFLYFPREGVGRFMW